MAQKKSKKKLLLFLTKEKINQELDSNNVPHDNDKNTTQKPTK